MREGESGWERKRDSERWEGWEKSGVNLTICPATKMLAIRMRPHAATTAARQQRINLKEQQQRQQQRRNNTNKRSEQQTTTTDNWIYWAEVYQSVNTKPLANWQLPFTNWPEQAKALATRSFCSWLLHVESLLVACGMWQCGMWHVAYYNHWVTRYPQWLS